MEMMEAVAAGGLESLSESFPAVAESVPHARSAVGAFAAAAGASEEQLHGIRLVVSEAVSNAVLHAYDGSCGQIHVTAALVPGELWVLVADDGCGLRAAPSPSRGLGLGLGWMAQFSDGLTLVTRSSGGLEVRMRFGLLGARLGADDSGAGIASFC
jgi:anti-sigma regulatory factor (Ser/Thr protein kinase)